MIYSRSSEYAIALSCTWPRCPMPIRMVKNIAEAEDIPAHFLAKILQQLRPQGTSAVEQRSNRRISRCGWMPKTSGCSILSRRWTAWRPTSSAPAGLPNATTTCLFHAR